MPNMDVLISGSNKSKLPKDDVNADLTCNCKENPCPLQGHCNTKNLVYKAELKSNPTSENYTYIGMTCRKFIEHFRIHKRSFNVEDTNSTTLSKKLRELKADDKPTDINFKTLKITKSYAPGDKFCQLCIAEKHLIIKEIKHNEKNSLNSRDELFSLCRHRARHKLNKVS